MTFLPVARRELLVASRRPATHRARIGAAVLAAGAALLVLLYITASGAGRQGGQFLFNVLWWGVQGFAVLAGTVLTADAIAEERRDGTLGLLCLAEVGGFEVVTGKFAGAALNVACAMLAVFPVMATAWFIGGITDGEFWRALAVSLNTLFVSLALGLFVSSVSRDATRALAVAVAAQAVLQLGLPGIVRTAALVPGAASLPASAALGRIDWISPVGAALRAGDARYLAQPGDFWGALALSHALGWALLAAAALVVDRSWRDRGDVPSMPRWAVRLASRFTGGRGRRLTAREVDRNPVAALFRRSRDAGRIGWYIAALALVTVLLDVTGGGGAVVAWGKGTGMGALYMAFRILFAWEACVFFGEARRTGAMDLVLATPLSNGAILRGQSRHLWTTLGLPAAGLVAAELAGVVAEHVVGSPNATGSLVRFLVTNVGLAFQLVAMQVLGAWLSMTESRPLVAFAKTLAIAGVVPAFMNYACCTGLAIPPLVIAWGSNKLSLPLRDVLSGVRSRWQLPSPPPR